MTTILDIDTSIIEDMLMRNWTMVFYLVDNRSIRLTSLSKKEVEILKTTAMSGGQPFSVSYRSDNSEGDEWIIFPDHIIYLDIFKGQR